MGNQSLTNSISPVESKSLENLTSEVMTLSSLSTLLEKIKGEQGEDRSLSLEKLSEKEKKLFKEQPEEKDKYLSLLKQKYLSEKEDPTRREMLWRQYNLYTELYKYYFDIALKANGFFYLITGGILTYFLTHIDEPYIRLSLLLPIILSVGLGGIFIYGAILIIEIRRDIYNISKELRLATAPEFWVLNASLIVFGAIFFIIAIALSWLMFIK